MQRYKAIILGNVPVNKNEVKNIEEFTKFIEALAILLKPSKWIFGLGNTEKENLSDMQNKYKKFLKNHESDEEILKSLEKEPSLVLMSLINQLQHKCNLMADDPNLKELSGSENIKLVSSLSQVLMKAKYPPEYHYFKKHILENKFESYSLEEEVLEGNAEEPVDDQKLSKNCDKEREEYYLEKIKALCQEKEKNIIVLLGRDHLLSMAKSIEKTNDIDYYFISTTSSAAHVVEIVNKIENINKELPEVSAESPSQRINHSSGSAISTAPMPDELCIEKIESKKDNWMLLFNNTQSSTQQVQSANTQLTSGFLLKK